MTGWYILGGILLVFFLIGLLPIKVDAGHDEKNTWLLAQLGPIKLRLYPVKERPKKEKKAKKPKDTESEKPQGDKLETAKSLIPLAKELLPLMLETAGRFRKKLQVERLFFHLTIPGARDPAGAAMQYGQANAALGAIWGPMNRVLNIRDGRMRVDTDFEGERYVLSAHLILSIRIGQVMWLGLRVGGRAFGSVLRYLKTQRRRKAVNAYGEAASHQ